MADDGASRLPAAVGLGVLLVLLATLDTSSFGAIGDGREMLSAATALARFAEAGVSLDFVNAVPRAAGDGFSRYGMGQSLALVPFVRAAQALHGVRASASTAPLFALLPSGLLALSAAALTRAALSLGATPAGAALGGAGLVLASPLLAYGATDFSEPFQVALVAVALAALVRLRSGKATHRTALLAGASLGLLPLVKSLLWVVSLPLLAAALLALPPAAEPPSREGVASAASAHRLPVLLAFALPAALWALLDLARFGRLLGGYPGETFSYPPLTGLLRLTVMPNKGLLLYAPLLLAAPLGLAALWRRDRPLLAAIASASAAVLASASAWWAWDGQAAWGPRLLFPALPALFLGSALAVDGRAWRRAASGGLFAAGLAVNLVGALVPFPGVYALAGTLPYLPIGEVRARGTPYEVEVREDGSLVASGPHHLSLTPSWSPIRIHALLLAERLRGGDVALRLAQEGLFGVDPPFRPAVVASPSAPVRSATSGFRWPFWGRDFLDARGLADDPYRLALRDQAVRSADTRRWERAVRLVEESLAGQAEPADPRVAAVGADAALRSGDEARSRRLLSLATPGCHPWLLFVRASLGEELGACASAAQAAAMRRSASAARRDGVSVSAWARAIERRAAER